MEQHLLVLASTLDSQCKYSILYDRGVNLGYYSQFNRWRVCCTGTVYSFNFLNMTRKVIFICFIKRFLTKSIGITGYMWVYDNYCIYELPWNSAWTWWLCLLGVDLGYYWFHRMAHGLQASSLYFTY